MYDLRLINGKCYIEGALVNTNIYIIDGKIAEISDVILPAFDSYSCEGNIVFPGIIDPHVHLELDLGEFVSADDFESGTRAAAFGGVTTIIDFLDPIMDNSDYRNCFNKRKELAKKSCIDYSFHCTLGNYLDNPENLFRMIEEDGLTSIKVFTTYSESNRRCSYNMIKKLFKSKFTILSHSEEDCLINSKHFNVSSFEVSRPESAENFAIKKLAKLVKETDGRLYIVHLSAGSSLEILKNEYMDLLNKNIFIESCPHYFYLTKESFFENGNKFLLAPPLRTEESINILKKEINYINTIATDHCPFLLDEKLRYDDASKIPKGIGSIEFSFLLMYQLYSESIIDKFTKNVAEIFQLKNKGEIKLGYDADLFVFDKNRVTQTSSGHSNCDYSVYTGKTLQGKVISTISRGMFIVKDNEFIGGKGKFVKREI